MDNFIMDVQGSGCIDFGDAVRLILSAMQENGSCLSAALVKCADLTVAK